MGTPPIDVTCSRSMQLHRDVGIEAARRHQHDLAAGRVVHRHRRQATGHVEQRHDEQRRRLHARFAPRGGGVPRIAVGDAEHDDVRQVRDHLAVRERRALRLAGRARRVEDREEVVLVERRFVEIGRPSPSRRTSAANGARRPRLVGHVADHEHVLERRDLRRAGRAITASRRASPISTFASESFEPELELLGLPPRVERARRPRRAPRTPRT